MTGVSLWVSWLHIESEVSWQVSDVLHTQQDSFGNNINIACIAAATTQWALGVWHFILYPRLHYLELMTQYIKACVCVCLLYNAVQIIALHINQEHEIIVSKNLSLEYGNIIRLRALDSIIYYPESERELSEQKKNKCCFKPVWAKPKLTTNSLTYFIPRGTDFSLFYFFSYLLMRPKKKVALSAGGKKPAFEKQIGKKMNKKSWEQDAWQI